VYSQISTDEEPISFRTNIPTLRGDKNTLKTLPSLDMERINEEDRADEANGIPPRFGYRHEVNYNLENSGEWVDLPDGDKIWRLVIYASDALSINLLYDKFWLPDGAKFFIYSNDRKHYIGAFTSVNNKGSRDDKQGFATGLVYGNQITLEYFLPKEIKETGIISIAYVVQGYKYILLPDKNYGQSGNCNININCTQGQNWQNEKNAVALILVNGNRYCTGSLVNTTANDGRPLFLTADHCLGGWANSVKHDAITAPNLSHWSFYWHYESPSCTSTLNPPFISTSGAMVVANNPNSDFALLQLTENPLNKNGVIPYYLGWDCSENAATGGVGIHHPSGDIKKITPYSITPQSTDYLNNTVDVNGNHWRITWSSGTTEGGSSGSPIINNNHMVIGQLHGGYASCSAQTQPDWYGKFSVSWTGNGDPDNRRRLNSWLDPNNTGVIVLDGCGNTNFTNQTVTTPTTVTSCGDINIQNITVGNNAKLELETRGKVSIEGAFTIDAGAAFEIK
jgi:V8-like Glu-specific endopeptidase